MTSQDESPTRKPRTLTELFEESSETVSPVQQPVPPARWTARELAAMLMLTVALLAALGTRSAVEVPLQLGALYVPVILAVFWYRAAVSRTTSIRARPRIVAIRAGAIGLWMLLFIAYGSYLWVRGAQSLWVPAWAAVYLVTELALVRSPLASDCVTPALTGA